MFDKIKENDRLNFPKNITRVTSGAGGESLLIIGSDKTALYDCGMAYCGQETVINIENELKKVGKDKLDYILLSHTHYDHIGALPYIKDRWKNALICGTNKTKKVFKSEGAKSLIKKLGEAARDLYGNEIQKKREIKVNNLDVDILVNDDYIIDIGNENIVVIETRGHTDCSLSFFLDKSKIMFASESTGVMQNLEYIEPEMLKSYIDCIKSAKKCEKFNPEIIISPHFGVVPKELTNNYFDIFIKCAEEEKKLCETLLYEGKTPQDILECYVNKKWNSDRAKEQPKEAFIINAKHIVENIMEYIEIDISKRKIR